MIHSKIENVNDKKGEKMKLFWINLKFIFFTWIHRGAVYTEATNMDGWSKGVMNIIKDLVKEQKKNEICWEEAKTIIIIDMH